MRFFIVVYYIYLNVFEYIRSKIAVAAALINNTDNDKTDIRQKGNKGNKKYKKQPLKVYCKKRVLKNFAKFTGKHLCWSLFLIKETPT